MVCVNPVLAAGRMGGDLDSQSSARPAPPRRSAKPAWFYLAGSVAAIAGAVFGPPWLRDPVMLLAILAGLGATVYAVRRVALPADRGPWRLLLAAASLFLVGIVIRAVVP